MSRILWIEDFEGDIPTTVDQVLGWEGCPASVRELKPWLDARGVTLIANFFDALRFVRSPARLEGIDYVVIDIDLKPYEDWELDDEATVIEIRRYLIEKHYLADSPDAQRPFGPAWTSAASELKKVAGYHIFTELLIDAGFPKGHILFCSNHGDQLGSIARAFDAAKLSPPEIHTKSDPFVRSWIGERRADPYSNLRRGVLMGSAAAARRLCGEGEAAVRFGLFFNRDDEPEWPPTPATPAYLQDYLGSLSVLLPLRAPESDEARKRRYRIFVHALSREWDHRAKVTNLPDKSDFIATCGTVMRQVRNWTSHTQLLDDMSAADVAYMALVGMRAMFAFPPEVQPHERVLLGIVERGLPCLGEEEAAAILGTGIEDRRLPLDPVYFETKRTLEDLRGPYGTDPYFDQLMRDLQRQIATRGIEVEPGLFLQSLYRMFWFYPSRMRKVKYGWTPDDTGPASSLFRHFDFGRNRPDSFVFQLARRILVRSFPETFGF